MDFTSFFILLIILLGGALLWFVVQKKKPVGSGEVSLVPGLENSAGKSSAAVERIVFGALDRPALAIAPFKFENAGSLEPLQLSGSKLSNLNGIFEHIPSIVSNTVTSGRKLYELKFSPQTSAALESGSAQLVEALKGGFRAIAADSSGKEIVEHARVFPVDGLQAATTAVAVWQVASMIVAQKHLADISEKLGEIVDALSDLKLRLDNERFGKLQGSLEYMQTVATALLDENLHVDELPQYRHKLEDIEHECLQVLSAVESDISAREKRLKNFESQDTFGTEKSYLSLNKEINDYETELKSWLLAVYVRGAACQLTAALPGGETIAVLRHDSIRATIEKMEFHSNIVKRVETAATKTLKSMFNTDSTIEERKNTLNNSLARASQLESDRKESIALTLDSAMRGIFANRRERDQGMHLVGELDDSGKLVQLSRVVNQ